MPPGASESRVRRRSSADSGPLRYQNDAAIVSGRSTIRRRAAMSTSGTFEPCPFTNRMRPNPCRCRLRPMSQQAVDERLPVDRDRPGEVHVVRRVAVGHGRQEQRPARAAQHRLLGQRLCDHDVGVDRQVVAVVLERRDRDHAHRVVLRPLGHLRPGQLGVAVWGLRQRRTAARGSRRGSRDRIGPFLL